MEVAEIRASQVTTSKIAGRESRAGGAAPDLERAILEHCAPSVKDNLVQTSLAAASRSNEA